MPQEVELFEGTIRDNVTLFDDAPTDAEVVEALSRAGLASLAEAGIHRNLGAGGAGLSAGESQLLALARVWLRQPDLVVLDEATARIDPVTEQRLEAAVAQLIEGRTTFIIAHKLSTLRMVDEVIVFDRGRIVEHDDREVLARSGSSRWRQLLELALEVDADIEPAMVEESVRAPPPPPTTELPTADDLPIWRIAWRAAQHEPRSFWVGWLAVRRVLLDARAHRVPPGARASRPCRTATRPAVYRCAIAVFVAEMARMASIHVGAIVWTKSWVHMQTLLRANLLTAQVASGGPEAGQPVGSAGEALTHFRDDTEDIAQLVDGMVDVSGGLVFTVAAGFLLGAADAVGAAVLLVPLIGVVLTTKALDGRIKQYRSDDREATAAVTGLVGDIMAAATTVKVNNATDAMLARLKGLVDHRRRTAVRDRVLDEGVMAFSQGAADVGLGLVLLVSAAALVVGFVRRRHAGPVRRLPRVPQLPAADGRADAGPAQAGDDRRRPHAAAGRRPRRRQRRPSPGAADRTAPARRAARAASDPSGSRCSSSRWSTCRPGTRAVRASTTSRSRCNEASSWC